MPKIADKPRIRAAYYYDLLEALTGKSRRSIRAAMRYRGLAPDLAGFVEYLKLTYD